MSSKKLAVKSIKKKETKTSPNLDEESQTKTVKNTKETVKEEQENGNALDFVNSILLPVFQLVEKEEIVKESEADFEKRKKQYQLSFEKILKTITKKTEFSREELEDPFERILISLTICSLFEFPTKKSMQSLKDSFGRLFIPKSTSKAFLEAARSSLHHFLHLLNQTWPKASQKPEKSEQSSEKKPEKKENKEASSLEMGKKINGKTWIAFELEIIQKLSKLGLKLIEPLNKSETSSFSDYSKMLTPFEGKLATEGIVRLAHSLLFFLFANDNSVFDGREEIFGVLEDLKQCCLRLMQKEGVKKKEEPKKKKKKQEDEEEEDMDESPTLVFADMLVDILSRPSLLLHQIAELSWRFFPGEISNDVTEMFMEILISAASKPAAPQNPEGEDDDEEDDGEDMEEEAEEEEAEEEEDMEGVEMPSGEKRMEDEEGPLLNDEDMELVDKEIIAALRAANQKNSKKHISERIRVNFLIKVADLLEIALIKASKTSGITILFPLILPLQELHSKLIAKEKQEVNRLAPKINSVIQRVLKPVQSEKKLNSEEMGELKEFSDKVWKLAIVKSAKTADPLVKVLRFIYQSLAKEDHSSEKVKEILESFKNGLKHLFSHKSNLSAGVFEDLLEYCGWIGWNSFEQIVEGMKIGSGGFEKILPLEFIAILTKKHLEEESLNVLKKSLKNCLNNMKEIEKEIVKRKKQATVRKISHSFKRLVPSESEKIDAVLNEILNTKLDAEEIAKEKEKKKSSNQKPAKKGDKKGKKSEKGLGKTKGKTVREAKKLSKKAEKKLKVAQKKAKSAEKRKKTDSPKNQNGSKKQKTK